MGVCISGEVGFNFSCTLNVVGNVVGSVMFVWGGLGERGVAEAERTSRNGKGMVNLEVREGGGVGFPYEYSYACFIRIVSK